MTGLTVYLCATCVPATRRQTRRQATLPQKAEASKLDAATAANLPVRRSGREGGKELGYGG